MSPQKYFNGCGVCFGLLCLLFSLKKTFTSKLGDELSPLFFFRKPMFVFF